MLAAVLVAKGRALLVAAETHVGDAVDPAAHRRPAAGQPGARRGDAGGLLDSQGTGHGLYYSFCP